jgi:putative MATE family efflux protein
MATKQIKILRDYSIPRALFKLSIPATLSMLISSLYNIIDTIFIGQNVGSIGITGLSIAFPIQMIALGVAGMFGMGGASIISRRLGEKNQDAANTTLMNVVLYSFVFEVFFIATGLIFLQPILRLFGATEAILPYATDYMKYIFPGFFFFIFGVCMNNIVRAEGHAKTSMISMLLGAISNIFLDYIFIVVLHKGIEGAAIATVIAQMIMAGYLLIFYMTGHSIFSFSLKFLRPSWRSIREICSIGFSALIFQASTALTAMLINNILAYYDNSELYIAVYGITIKITSFMYMPIIGIRQGAQPILGYAFGAKNYIRSRELIRTTFKIMFAYSFVMTALVLVFTPAFVAAFANEPEFIRAGTPIVRIVVCMMAFVPVNIFGSSIFMSVGRAKESIFASLLKQAISFIPACIILSLILGPLGVWIAFPASDVISALICIIMIKKFYNELKRMPDTQQINNL